MPPLKPIASKRYKENNFGNGAGISKSDFRAYAIAPKKKKSIGGLKAFWMKRLFPISGWFLKQAMN